MGITPACAGSTPGWWPRGRPASDHPRLRGEHSIDPNQARTSGGSPPPARGAPATSTAAGPRSSDHPRLRGEHEASGLVVPFHQGSPPPARGAPRHTRWMAAYGRITPACAGSTARRRRSTRVWMDHPRLRGEHVGSHRSHSTYSRITPACAGSTWTSCRCRRSGWDHPRLRGEHVHVVEVVGELDGSPPPARGALARRVDRHRDGRITPACAGSTPRMMA